MRVSPVGKFQSFHPTPIEKIPTTVITSILFPYLDPPDVVNLGQSNKYFHSLSKNPLTWKTRLKTSTREKLNLNDPTAAKTIFELYPELRLDNQVPTDKKGLNYLKSLGITNPHVIKFIKMGITSIEQSPHLLAQLSEEVIEKLNKPRIQRIIVRGQLEDKVIEGLKFLNKEGQLILAPERESMQKGQYDSWLSSVDFKFLIENPIIQTIFELGYVTIPQLWRLKKGAYQNLLLKNVTLQKYLIRGELSLPQLLKKADIFPENLQYLDDPITKNKLETGELTIQKALENCYERKFFMKVKQKIKDSCTIL